MRNKLKGGLPLILEISIRDPLFQSIFQMGKDSESLTYFTFPRHPISKSSNSVDPMSTSSLPFYCTEKRKLFQNFALDNEIGESVIH